jgi:hypothetical protein
MVPSDLVESASQSRRRPLPDGEKGSQKRFENLRVVFEQKFMYKMAMRLNTLCGRRGWLTNWIPNQSGEVHEWTDLDGIVENLKQFPGKARRDVTASGRGRLYV